jgi:predicted Fe-Mo cluster-binding NifX family protein
VIIYKFTQGNIGTKKIRQKPISVASQEKKSQIATLAIEQK